MKAFANLRCSLTCHLWPAANYCICQRGQNYIIFLTGEETLLAASCHISSILGHFNHQNLALTLWAFAKLGWRPDTALLAHACQHALLTVQTINPQNLANILWAFATLEFIPTTAMLEVCCSPPSAFSDTCMPNTLAFVTYEQAACSRLGFIMFALCFMLLHVRQTVSTLVLVLLLHALQ